MLKLEVSEGYAFDMLSIYQVKADKFSADMLAFRNYADCFDSILKQVGPDLFYRVYNSEEYITLYAINKKLFELIDSIKKPSETLECKDKEIDGLNFSRSTLKSALQKKFFPNTINNEQKFGYESR